MTRCTIPRSRNQRTSPFANTTHDRDERHRDQRENHKVDSRHTTPFSKDKPIMPEIGRVRNPKAPTYRPILRTRQLGFCWQNRGLLELSKTRYKNAVFAASGCLSMQAYPSSTASKRAASPHGQPDCIPTITVDSCTFDPAAKKGLSLCGAGAPYALIPCV